MGRDLVSGISGVDAAVDTVEVKAVVTAGIGLGVNGRELTSNSSTISSSSDMTISN